jgi:hypothetical protein
MRLLAVLVLAFAATACKGDKEKCEQAARNFATLTYWDRTNAELAKLPEGEREGARKKKLSAFTNELEGKIDVVVSQCQSANNDDQVDCMIAAKTAKQVLDCADLVPKE